MITDLHTAAAYTSRSGTLIHAPLHAKRSIHDLSRANMLMDGKPDVGCGHRRHVWKSAPADSSVSVRYRTLAPDGCLESKATHSD
jgi:hypothetical protein